jgi:hypothetical protein
MTLCHVVERTAQAAMVIVLQGHETERLQHALIRLLHGSQYFGHSMHGASLCLESNFDKVALAKRIGDA